MTWEVFFCETCKEPISDRQWAENWGKCPECFDKQYAEYLATKVREPEPEKKG